MARILVVDDDDLVLEMFRDIIEFIGHDVTTRNNGESALEYIQGGAPIDLLVTDIVMPKLSGDQLTSMILQSTDIAYFPILIVSGEFWMRDLKTLLEHERVCFVQKPVGVGELKAAINSCLKKAEAYL